MFVLPPSLLHESLLLDVIEHLPAGVFAKDVSDDFRFVIWNTEMERIFSTPRVEMLGKNDYDFFERSEADYYRETDVSVMKTGGVVNIARENVTTSRGHIIAHTIKVPVKLSDGRELLLGILEDITEVEGNRKEIEHYQKHLEDLVAARTLDLEKLASTDMLTGLSNRASFFSTVTKLIENGEGKPFSLIFLDLDRFKIVNDTFGHDFGDQFLTQIGGRLETLIDEVIDIVRVGGDEFAILVNVSVYDTVLDQICNKISVLFRTPFQIDNHFYTIDVSMGFSGFPHDALTPRQLLQNADMAMYHAKYGRRKKRWERYTPHLRDQLATELEMDQGLRKALDEGGLYLEYQAQFSVNNYEEIVGLEALIRWRSVDSGVISPAIFVPVAEKTGLIHRMTDFVLETVCRDIRRLGEAGIVCPRISVNLSGSEFNEDTATRIQSVLEQYEINPGALTIEITENAKINASATAFDNLKELRRRGLRLSIDDFGTGYSSLAYLSELDVDEIKIDKSFIQSATTSARHKSIVQAILGICSVFGYAVVAEGVETKDQAELLSNQADATLQGFWLGVPCSLDAIGLRGSSCAHRPDGLSMRQWPDASGQTPNQTACF